MGYADCIDRFNLSLVQDAEMRTGSLRRIIFGLDRENMAGHIAQLHNLHGEIIPAANAAAGAVVNAVIIICRFLAGQPLPQQNQSKQIVPVSSRGLLPVPGQYRGY